MNKKNMPEIRFSGFDDEWTQIFVKDLFLLSAEGGTPSTKIKENYENGSIPFVKIEDTTNKYIYNTKTRITEEGLNNSSAWLIPKNSIIFTNGATIGNISINKIPVSTKQGIMGLIVKNNFDLEYIYYSLSTDAFSEKVWDKVAIGTFPWITTKNFNNLNFKYSSNSFEQNKIGLFLKNIDDLISKTEKQYNYFKNIKESLLNKMFPSNYSDVPEIRFKEFKDILKVNTLGNLLKYEQPGKYIVENDEYNDEKAGVPVLTAGQSFILGYTLEKFGIKNSSKTDPIIIFDDFITSSYYIDFPFKVKSSAIKILSTINKKSNLYYLYMLLKQQQYSVVNHERHWISKFSKFNVLITESASEQTKIGTFFKNLDDLIELIKQKHEKLKNIKNALLDKMFC